MFGISICIEMIFGEVDFLKRIESAADCGADGFEFWGWKDKDLDAIADKKGEAEIELVAVTGGAGSLNDPDEFERAVLGLEKAIAVARDLDCPNVIVTTGQEMQDIPRRIQHDAVVRVLREAALEAEENDVMLVLEPLNTAVDHQGYYLHSSYEGYEILDSVGSSHVRLLFDIYHQQITEGNIIENIRSHINYIGHFHIADVPGRREPGTGELNYERIFEAIAKAGYERYVGCEFRPSGDSRDAVQSVLDLIEQG